MQVIFFRLTQVPWKLESVINVDLVHFIEYNNLRTIELKRVTLQERTWFEGCATISHRVSAII